MKSLHFIFSFILLLILTNCSGQNKAVVTPALAFGWNAPQKLQVVETIQKKGNTFKIAHDCELIKTNEEFEIHWLDAKILEVNGERLDDSEELKSAMKPLQASFIYPSFRVGQNGQFLETINPEDYTKRSDQLLDAVATNRTEESREYFANFSKSETGRKVLNQFSQLIWQTWVEAWTDVVLTNGESRSANGTIEFLGIETPMIEKISNLGLLKADTNAIRLRYEQDFIATNCSTGLNDFLDKIVAETKIKSAGSITNQFSIERQTVLEVQTERQTLKPHWAKRTVKTVFSAPAEITDTDVEIHEYNFHWEAQKNSVE